MEGHAGWSILAAEAVVGGSPAAHPVTKSLLAAALKLLFRWTEPLRRGWCQLLAHSALAARLAIRLPASVVVVGRVTVEGTGAVTIGENALLYPGVYLETQAAATILLGEGVVLSRGVHVVAMAGITIGRGTMIGEYTSIRDANHLRSSESALRDAGFAASPIAIGEEVWIGRGATILPGVKIGDRATIGANAVVTREVGAGETVGGVPAVRLRGRGGVEEQHGLADIDGHPTP